MEIRQLFDIICSNERIRPQFGRILESMSQKIICHRIINLHNIMYSRIILYYIFLVKYFF